MNEFFNASTSNHRKREIGIYLYLKTQFLPGCIVYCAAWISIEIWLPCVPKQKQTCEKHNGQYWIFNCTAHQWSMTPK